MNSEFYTENLADKQALDSIVSMCEALEAQKSEPALRCVIESYRIAAERAVKARAKQLGIDT